MSKFFTLDLNSQYDISIVNGDFATVSGKKAYAIVLEAALRTVRGEIKDEPTIGIPYFETVFKSLTQVATWKMAVIARVKKFPFVKNIKDFEILYDRKACTITYYLTVETDDGDVVLGNGS